MKDIMQLPISKDFDGYSPKYHFFKNSLLDQIHDSLPWEALSALLPEVSTGCGAPALVRQQGHVCSDVPEGLSQRFRPPADRTVQYRRSLQYFWNKVLADNQQVRDTGIMTCVRAHIEEHCN
ncbi:hypothetical protein [Echinicola soli]|uniref:hypothetical protein n=1 Tax=Echinicola soli TaxID=2591634 RepID=UPI001AF00A03|nr:hypothetical protein [Echinicola soli]